MENTILPPNVRSSGDTYEERLAHLKKLKLRKATANKSIKIQDLLLPCTLIPVKLTLHPSGEVTYAANHFQDRLAVMCSTYRAELAAFLGTLPDGRWDSMKDSIPAS
jgi:hypothetical protein